MKCSNCNKNICGVFSNDTILCEYCKNILHICSGPFKVKYSKK